MREFIIVFGHRVSVQSAIIAVCGLVFAAATVIAAPQLWWSSLLVLPAFLVASYNVNCAVVGNCVTWAWVLTIVYASYAILALGSAMMGRSSIEQALGAKA